jgi:hypothetical protein
MLTGFYVLFVLFRLAWLPLLKTGSIPAANGGYDWIQTTPVLERNGSMKIYLSGSYYPEQPIRQKWAIP